MPKLSKRKRQLREIHIKRRLASANGEDAGYEDECTTTSASSVSDSYDAPSNLAHASLGKVQQIVARSTDSVEDSDDETPTISQLYARKTQMMVDQRLNLGAAAAAAPALSDVWVQCNRCNKWRRLPADTNVKKLPRKWYCTMNEFDPPRQNCDAPEEDYTTPAAPLPALDMKIEHGKNDEPEDVVTADVATNDLRKFCGLWSRRLRSMDLAESRLSAGARRHDDSEATEDFEWVRCCNPLCGKWRVVSKALNAELVWRKQQFWYCSMNATDETVASCSAPQEALWDCTWNLRKLRPEERNSVFDDYSDDDGDGSSCTAKDVRAVLTTLKRELARSR